MNDADAVAGPAMTTLALIDLPLPSHWVCRALDAGQSLDAALADTQGWHQARVPGNVYQDLLQEGLIPDPHAGMNERDVQWVAQRDWVYRLDFDMAALPADGELDLVCEGLDTFAQVWLNGHCLLRSDNMFVPHRLAARPWLREGANRLVLVFESALRRGHALEAEHGKLPLWNGDSSRLYVRKAPYHYGWDWGPVLLTSGPWKPVRLQSYSQRLCEVHTSVAWGSEGGAATVTLEADIAGSDSQKAAELCYVLHAPDGQEVASRTFGCIGAKRVIAEIPVREPELWWPAGMGAQPLYRLVIELRDASGSVLDRCERKLGLRRLALLQQPVEGEAGSSFHFSVNGREFFTGGANWIPDDNLLNRITPERYRERVQQARDANMVMLRVWAGGIYEDEAFYDACDELGLLVWQDFLFACGIYPGHDAFVDSVRQEAMAAIKRLRHRASLALWCGNNEDYAIAETHGRYGPGIAEAQMPARRLYEKVLPELCAALDPDRPYWPGSPYSPSEGEVRVSSDQTVGDRHTWEVWHGQMAPYADYHKFEGRFVSEFGMQSHPSLALLQKTLAPVDQHPHSESLAWHNKAGLLMMDGHRRLAVYLADTLRVGPTLADQVYATQFVQAEAMRYAYQDYRRRWQRPGARGVGGALVWQLNDCWPSTSWALIDSSGEVKPAWHAVRRALAPLSVAVRQGAGGVRAWVMSSLAQDVSVALTVQLHDLPGGLQGQARMEVIARANSTTEVALGLSLPATPVVATVQLHDGPQVLARDSAWPEPFRFQDLGDAGLEARREGPDWWLSVERPLKGLWLSAPGLQFTDNFIDLVPGAPVRVGCRGDASAPLTAVALAHAARSLG
jgi:beta-mannosidase